MTIDRGELKKKVMEAAGAEEVMEIVQAAGEEITAEEAAVLFEKAQKQKEDQELSLDELEAVSGGADRDWLKDGCAATAEWKSWCDSNDACMVWDVTYDNKPSFDTVYPCPNCGKVLGAIVFFEGDGRCVYCGRHSRYERSINGLVLID